MKTKFCFVLILYLLLGSFMLSAQTKSMSLSFTQLEEELKIQLPKDYLDFVKAYENQDFYFYFKIEDWYFRNATNAKALTEALRAEKRIGANDFAFATNEEEQVIFFKVLNKELSSMVYHLDEEGDVSFYAFSISEFTNFEKTNKLIEEISSKGFEQQDRSVLSNCTGSKFEYAIQLNTSKYDDDFSEARNKKALELFREAAEEGHPSAAHEMASYYYFQDEMDMDSVILWRERAIALGSEEDKYELADFILDYQLEKIDQAISLLEDLAKAPTWRAEKAKLKLSRIYMRGTGGKTDYGKGLKYAEECAQAENYNAISDLAYYYYKGIGLEKDIKKAHQLLVEANQKVIAKTGSGMWEEFISQLEKEMKE